MHARGVCMCIGPAIGPAFNAGAGRGWRWLRLAAAARVSEKACAVLEGRPAAQLAMQLVASRIKKQLVVGRSTQQRSMACGSA